MSRCYAEKQVLNSITTKLKGWTLQQTEINIMIGRLITSAYKNDLNISDIREERRKTASMMNCRTAAMYITYKTYWCLMQRCMFVEYSELLSEWGVERICENLSRDTNLSKRCRETAAKRTLPTAVTDSEYSCRQVLHYRRQHTGSNTANCDVNRATA